MSKQIYFVICNKSVFEICLYSSIKVQCGSGFLNLIWRNADVHCFSLDLCFIAVDGYCTDSAGRPVWINVQSSECLCTLNGKYASSFQHLWAIHIIHHNVSVWRKCMNKHYQFLSGLANSPTNAFQEISADYDTIIFTGWMTFRMPNRVKAPKSDNSKMHK